jgi:hypothetical protein
MPQRIDHTCASGACRNAVPAGKSFCDACAALRTDTHYAEPEIARLYNSQRWRKMAALLRSKNPLCQYLDDFGVQCQHASTICHHLVDPKDNARIFFDWLNVVAVCAAHHQGGQRGETQGYHYCHTIGTMDAVYPHGFVYPVWHAKYEPPRGGELLVAASTSSVGAAAIAAALAEPI